MAYNFTAAKLAGAFDDMCSLFGDPDLLWTSMAADLAKWQSEMAYQGFDPRVIHGLIRKRINGTAFGSKDKDISFMIKLYCERGNKISKISNTVTPDLKKKIEKLRSVYPIQDSAKTQKTITLARVAIAFPRLTCEYMLQCHNPTVAPSTLDDLINGTYPKVMMTGAFSSLIPDLDDDEQTRLITKAHALHQIKFDRVINRNLSGPYSTDELSKVSKFIRLGANNDYIPNDKRLEWLHKWGVLSSSDKKAKATADVVKAAKAYDNLIAGSTV